MDNELSDKVGGIPLIEGDVSEYFEKYVAVSSFNSRKVVAYGKNPAKVIEDARRKGHKTPVIIYVPNPDIDYIYSVA